IFLLAALLVVLFEENRATGIGDERAGSRKTNIAGAVLNFNWAAQEGRITCHEASVQMDSSTVNSTNGFMRKILWKIVSSRNSFVVKGEILERLRETSGLDVNGPPRMILGADASTERRGFHGRRGRPEEGAEGG